MHFITDRQTLNDLHIFGKGGRDGIFHLFQYTHTRGGAELMENMFRYPLAEAHAINNRCQAIQYLQLKATAFPFVPEWFDAAEQYLADVDERSKLRGDGDTMGRKLNNLIGADTQFNSTVSGLSALWNIMATLRAFADSIGEDAGETLVKEASLIRSLLADMALNNFLQAPLKKADYTAVAAFDVLIRFTLRDCTLQLLSRCYLLDVFLAAGSAAGKHGFAFAVAAGAGNDALSIAGLYHPLVPQAVGNDLRMDADSNILFLTGANMAGKSTFMKSTGIALYLAHVGFPVPARTMSFSVRQGLLTSINLSDNLLMGHSHFYAEVLRVKLVSEHLAKGHSLFVIFDELFRGTNVKDAYDATIAITEAYGRHPNCFFIVSTHIIEAADVLKQRSRNIRYVFLPTLMEGNTPHYTYRLQAGVTADRHGLVIINNEGIPGILAKGNKGDGVLHHTMTDHHAGEPAFFKEAAFLTDEQTLEDLNLTGKYKSKSIFGLFNDTVTNGGEQLLEHFFRSPLSDAQAINARSELFAYFSKQSLRFPIGQDLFSRMVNYLRTARAAKPVIVYRALLRRAQFLIGVKESYALSLDGLRHSIKALALLRVFLQEEWTAIAPASIQEKKDRVLRLLDHPKLAIKKAIAVMDTLSWKQAIAFEVLLLGELHEEMEFILGFLYELDVFIAVGNVGQQRGFTRAMAYPKEKHTLVLHEAWHPAIEKAVSNNVYMDSNSHLIFLTGANMAGKSTIMKTLGVSFYLAHMGFPVPARDMDFSVMEGIFTSINVPDNLDKGYSHFYAEVMRVKKVAQAVASGKQLLIIFDELFKGTNVKDAFDATLLVSEALADYPHCQFVISTHIVEVGHELQKHHHAIQFKYMPTVMQGHTPHYPYRMADGISNDRHGMLIINNEHVLDMLALPQDA